MKKFSTLFALLFLFSLSKAQYVDLPNTEFKTMLIQKYPSCFNASQQLNTSCTLIASEDSLEFHQLGISLPVDLEGIQYFTALKYLNCSHNNISSSPALPASLIYLDYSSNGAGGPGSAFLPVMPAKLLHLDISGNYFNSIIFPDSLRYLDCSGNSLISLGTLPAKLDTLLCTGQNYSSPNSNILTSLPTLPATLTYVDCSNNALTGLPALPASLHYLNCSAQHYNTDPETIVNTLPGLPALPASLAYINCSLNKLTVLPALPTSLTYLDCSYNRYNNPVAPFNNIDPGINVLPTLPTTLQNLICNFNQLVSLPALPATLKQLSCSYNNITTLPKLPALLIDLALKQNQVNELPVLPLTLAHLDCELNNINCLPHLPPSMGGQSPYETANELNLIIDRDKILCIPNNVAGLRPGSTINNQLIAITPALCTPVNNANKCVVYPVIAGNIFYDNNSNGVKDAGELFKANVKVQLSNGLSGYSDNNGYYELSADLGAYTLTINPPPYYNAVPSSVNYNFTTYDTLATNLISLQSNISVDSVSISILPLTGARPGFDYSYVISYENVGTTIVYPFISFPYDNTRISYLNSTNAFVVNNGSALSLSLPGFTPGEKGIFTANFRVNTNAVLGDSIFAQATLTAGSSVDRDSTFSPITGSYDPNDKQATPSLTSAQAANGNYINYFIRFQNTGTDTAFNIVVTDTLNTLLQAGTLQIIEASHPCKITQNGNIISFEFLDILLPDSNVNSVKSHGYVKFRIKPLGTLPVSSIENKADIYFDYNIPVATNAALTTIVFDALPLKLLSFKALTQPGNDALLYWNTTNEENIRSFSIEQSTDGRTFNFITTVIAKNAGVNNYMKKVRLPGTVTFYRLKIINSDGRFTYSDIVTITGVERRGGIIVLDNPVRDLLKIMTVNESLNNTKATVINGSGAMVKTFLLLTGMQTIDVHTLPAGGYFIRSKFGTQKLIVIK